MPCGGRLPGFRPGPRPPTVRDMAPIPTPSAQPDDSPGAYVGLAADAAERRARSHGWDTVRSLPPGTIITMEFRSGRINFEVDDAVVTRCWVG
jgi:hypothetical protein